MSRLKRSVHAGGDSAQRARGGRKK